MTKDELRHMRLAGLMQGVACRAASNAIRVLLQTSCLADSFGQLWLLPSSLVMVGGMAELANNIELAVWINHT